MSRTCKIPAAKEHLLRLLIAARFGVRETAKHFGVALNAVIRAERRLGVSCKHLGNVPSTPEETISAVRDYAQRLLALADAAEAEQLENTAATKPTNEQPRKTIDN
jgi:protein-arginine kinase activator protein McsA